MPRRVTRSADVGDDGLLPGPQRFDGIVCISGNRRWSWRRFGEFVDAALPRLLGLAHILVGNPHDAWDLTQETLARVGLHWRRVDRSGNRSGTPARRWCG